MNNKKGFTMVELLTVILVLSILALILVPVISGLLESSSKHAFRNSVMGIIDASNNYMNARKGIKYTGEITYPIIQLQEFHVQLMELQQVFVELLKFGSQTILITLQLP